MANGFFNKNKLGKRNSRGASAKVVKREKKKTFLFPKKTMLTILVTGLIYFGLSNFQNLYEKVNTQKIEYIVIDGSLDYVSEEEVKEAVFGFIDQALVAMKLDEIKTELERNPWIKSVGIKREWPATLIINVSEERAIAHWGKNQLLNQEGEIFSPETVLNQTYLPYLSGPVGTQQQVMEQYQEFNQLLYPQGLRIASLELNNRYAWTIDLESGAKIKVGNEMMMQRMRRFVSSIDAMFIESLASINTIDLRYRNGIAVSKKANTNEDVVSL